VTLGPLEAYEQVMGFAFARGEMALCLAMHAAMPQVLRLDLLHLLRLNFVSEAIDDPAVEADVLFAPFCESLGNGYYRFDAHARQHLVKQLDPHYRAEHGQRSRRVASFLLSYFDEQLRVTAETNDVVYAAYVEVERWVALAFFEPDAAARQLAGALRRMTESGPAVARFRFAGLASALATPLAGQRSLLAYTVGIEALERGDVGKARDALEPLGDAEVVVAGVSLASPADVLRQWQPATSEDVRDTRKAEPELEGETVSEVVLPRRSSVDPSKLRGERGTIFVSSSHTDRRWLDELLKFLQPLVREKSFDLWDDRRLVAGRAWKEAIDEAMERARMAVVLVSASYLASDFAGLELEALLRRVRSGQLRLAWVLVEDCDWRRSPLVEYQAAHDVTHPLSGLRAPQRTRALADIARGIGHTLDEALPSRSEQRPGIFLCYRRGDNQLVGMLSVELQAAFGANNLFQDLSSIPAGADFRTYIRETAAGADVMVVVIGRDWLGAPDADGRRRIDDEDDYVRFEVAVALRSEARVIPVLVGGAKMPSAEELPPDIRPLTRRNVHKLSTTHFREDLDRLMAAVTAALPEGSFVERSQLRRQPVLRLRVFVSSTYQDLVEYRRAVTSALKGMENVEAIYMEGFDASPVSPEVRYLHELDSCNVLVLIVGWRYGWVPPGEERSITELEFRHARERNMPVLAFLASEEMLEPQGSDAATGDADGGARVRAFRDMLMEQLVVDIFTSPDDIARRVVVSVANLLQRLNADQR
jgi:hypothetical protein